LSLFVSFEGGEGSGKTTQAKLLAERLRQGGISPLLVREPGTTPLGRYLREWLKRQNRRADTISDVAELFLFAAARAEVVAKVLRPALKQKSRVVVADRYADSTTAYQGYGRRMRQSDVELINRLATQGVMPDLTFLLDCPPVDGLTRVGAVQISLPLEADSATELGRADQVGSRRFEEESLDFHQRVRSGYLEIARQEPDRWCVVDANRSVEEISVTVWERVERRLSEDSDGEGTEPAPNLPLWAGGPEGDSDRESD